MLSIGRRKPTERLVDLLLECHERIRSFSQLAVAVAERSDATPADIRDACERCERYFREALPLHVADEEESLVPRLMGRSAAVDAALLEMSKQHVAHRPLLGELLQTLTRVHASPADTAARQALQAAAGRVVGDFAEHLALEEQVILPAIDALLSAAEQAQIVTELRARRRPGP